ncbi:hypothetical protein [Methylorubrum extorquens]|uniref:hypothetical protein n=1 Tax=Methylorubrum extorquens TaxID=408 RepID=UPI000158F2F9|nr:hypothetical protein [Methylorubrum extorquens]ABY30270.1 hypothetical protein Mext_1871 [Methylorubrum extorquens PA1]KQP93671.1 hypothetical protein ASF55_20450 [Methylobacterium sp. Leaf119]WIU41571.1 hypothetical protein KQ926_09835 [Methylorubrum extorquens]
MMTAIDELWFMAHPERQYRLRRLTTAEIMARPVLPPPFHTVWAVIRHEPAQTEVLAARRSVGPPTKDQDFELEWLFDFLSRPPEVAPTDDGGEA